MTIPRGYRTVKDRTLTSFNFSDVATGEGYVRLYGVGVNNDDTEDYILTNQAIIPDDENGAQTQTNNELTFDLSPFNYPRTIQGKIIISFNANIAYSTGSGSAAGYFTIKVYKNTTQIATENTATKTVTSGQGNLDKHYTLTIDLSKQDFNVDDVLKISFDWVDTVGTITATIYHDPTTSDRELEFYVPFRAVP